MKLFPSASSVTSRGIAARWLVLVGIVWIFPLGLLAPKFIVSGGVSRWNIWDCAALFTRRAKVWGDVRAEARTAAGWQRLDFAQLSPQGLAGYRQRLDRVLEETVKQKKTNNMVSAVSQHVAEHAARLGLGHLYEPDLS